MYLEYAKNEVSNHELYVDAYNYLVDNMNNTWPYENIVRPYFGPTLGRKIIGHRLIFWIIVPAALNGIVLLYCILSACCCSSSQGSTLEKSKGASKKVVDDSSSKVSSSDSK